MVIYLSTIYLIASCETSKSNLNNEPIHLSLYQQDSLKYGQECAEFLAILSSAFYINNQGKVMSNISLDTLIRNHESCLREMSIEELSAHLDTQVYVIRYFKPYQASIPFDLLINPYFFNDTMRYITFSYRMDETYWAHRYSYVGHQERID